MTEALIEIGADLLIADSDGDAPFCQSSVDQEARVELALALIGRAADRDNMTRRMLQAFGACSS